MIATKIVMLMAIRIKIITTKITTPLTISKLEVIITYGNSNNNIDDDNTNNNVNHSDSDYNDNGCTGNNINYEFQQV